ncbi:MAG: aminopeptidase [Pseudohongiellaceae bacterium]
MTRAAVLLLLLVVVSGCRTVGYYGQAVSGHLRLLWQREPVEVVLARDDLPQATRAALQRAVKARDFAAQRLGLDAGGSYSDYVMLERSHVVWNVFAAPADSLDLVQWCFPVAGCVGYRGYFSRKAAEREAGRLAARGHDVFTGGVGAYSTLGWFNDPLTTPMLQRPPHALVALIFHELAHQRVYLAGDTEFNESFATFVEQEGLRQWHEAGFGEPDDLQAWNLAGQRRAGFVTLVQHHSARLEALYARQEDAADVQRHKGQILHALQEDYAALKECWGVDAYGSWFDGPLNNARLATVGAYHQWVPAFAMLMKSSGGDWQAFHEAVEGLAKRSPERRQRRLEGLLEQASGDPEITPPPATPCVPVSS